METSYIYKIESKIYPDRIYIGSAVILNRRWNRHLSDLRLNRHSNKILQNHFNKYGEDDLIFSVLLGCNKEDLIKTEQYFIDFYNPYFNVLKIAGSTLGHHWKLSPESCKKLSERKKGNKNWLGKSHSEETKKRISKIETGKIVSKETREKLSNSHLRYIPSKETKKKMSESGKKAWELRKTKIA